MKKLFLVMAVFALGIALCAFLPTPAAAVQKEIFGISSSGNDIIRYDVLANTFYNCGAVAAPLKPTNLAMNNNRRLYYMNPFFYTIWQADLDLSNNLINQQVLTTITPYQGIIDGFTIGPDQNLYMTGYGQSKIYGYNIALNNGTLTTEVTLVNTPPDVAQFRSDLAFDPNTPYLVGIGIVPDGSGRRSLFQIPNAIVTNGVNDNYTWEFFGGNSSPWANVSLNLDAQLGGSDGIAFDPTNGDLYLSGDGGNFSLWNRSTATLMNYIPNVDSMGTDLAFQTTQSHCCIDVTPGKFQPADHNWQYDPANPNAPNLMMHANLCLMNCPTPAPIVTITGVQLVAGGTGNSNTDINWIKVTYDLNCNGVADPGEPWILSTGGFPLSGLLNICDTGQAVQFGTSGCLCLMIEYNLKPTTPCNKTFNFTLAQVLTGPDCQPQYSLCGHQPLQSATKTVICDPSVCCLQVSKATTVADHVFNCDPDGTAQPNLMQHVKICNPCTSVQSIYGFKLQAGGTGPPSNVQQIQVFLDADCDGVPDSPTPVLTGTYGPGGVATLCSAGPIVDLAPSGTQGACACFLIYYKMICPPTSGSYSFQLTDVLGPNCLPVMCATGTPLASAIKYVPPTPEGGPDKWLQLPDLATTGVDAKATYPLLLADDFPCTKHTKITNITVWGSWLKDVLPANGPGQATFTLSIHSDIPANPPLTSYSKPGATLWQKSFGPGQFAVNQYGANIDEGWYDPSIGQYIFPGDHACWRYDFTIPAEDAFCQEGIPTEPKVYWLDVQAAVKQGPPNGLVLPDNGHGTADLPPVGYAYGSPNGDMYITEGLDEYAAVGIDASLQDFANIVRQPDGSLGGEVENFNAQLKMPMVGVGNLAGFHRDISLPVTCQVYNGPRTPGDPIQSFDTEMRQLQGELPPGDPDFDLLRITAGAKWGLPSPGHTTLTRQSSGGWAVDGSYDINYQIDFVGKAGGPLSGLSGTTVGTVPIQIPGDISDPARFGWKTSLTHWNDDAVWGLGPEPHPGPWTDLHYPPGNELAPLSIDLAFQVSGDKPCDPYDWGDAPDSYQTLAANNGPSHLLSNVYMGAKIDAEPNGQPGPLANGDDLNGAAPNDDDGVVINGQMWPGKAMTVTIISSIAGARVDGWIDFNGDGSFATAGDHILNAALLPVAGANTLTFVVPNTATAGIATYARFRIHTNPAGIAYFGPCINGEVEDYKVNIYKKTNKGEAKALQVGSFVLIQRDIVTGNFGASGWYFEEPNRSAGLGVLPIPGAVAPWEVGQVVSAYGYTTLNGSELMLQEEGSWLEPDQFNPITPVMLSNRASGGGIFGRQPGMIDRVGDASSGPDVPASGLNTVGLLVTLCGKCTGIEDSGGSAPVQTNFWIDDGSGLYDGNTVGGPDLAHGVKVRVPEGYSGPAIEVGGYYTATGIMGTDTTPSGKYRRWQLTIRVQRREIDH